MTPGLALFYGGNEEDEGLDITQHGEDAYPDFSGDQSILL
jgi:ammonia channel protein AmtB